MVVAPLVTPLNVLKSNPAGTIREERPNILWIVSEDNMPLLGCYGDKRANTPNLDKLAAEGVLYRNACASAPVCAPTRCAIITGVYPPSMGTEHMRSARQIPDMIKLFPQYLREAGYYCTNHSKTDYNLSPVDKNAWNAISSGDHTKREAGQPFFAVYNLATTHESSLHKPVDYSLAKADVEIPPYHPDTPEIRANWAMYYQTISKMDGQVGEILENLQKEGVADDTIVFYYSDHGGILPRSKRFLYDTGVRVPMIVRFGKKFAHLAPTPPGSVEDRPVAFIDLAPTVLSLAGVEIPDYMQGHAFLGHDKSEPRKYNYTFRGRMDERYDMMRSVRDNQFKYIRNYMPHRIWGQHLQYLFKMPATQSWYAEYEKGRCKGPQRLFWEPKPVEELYDFTKDPWEVNNLANDPKCADVLKRMRKDCREHWLEVRDGGFIPEGERVRRAEEADMTIYEYVRNEKQYPLEEIMAVAEMAGEGKPETLPNLKDLLDHKDSAVRYWAATGCLILGEKAAAAARKLELVMAGDESPDVRIVAAEALWKLGRTEKALEVLAEMLSHSNEYVSLHAMNVLTVMGDDAKPVLPAIEKAAKSGGYTRRAAHTAVKTLSEK